jgi:hypothetical protein
LLPELVELTGIEPVTSLNAILLASGLRPWQRTIFGSSRLVAKPEQALA